MPEQPWYYAGLKFRCTGCGRCCTGEPGFVWVNQAEIEALARALGIESALFQEQFVRVVGRRKSLLELPNGDCVFFNRLTRQCRVYAHRPRQCRTWPFWQSNLRTPGDWDATCRACPGSGNGPTAMLAQIEAKLGEVEV